MYTDEKTPRVYNCYQPFDSIVNDQSILTFGRYKGFKLIDVPSEWLIFYFESPMYVKNFWLMKYIVNNLEKLKK